MNLVSFSASSKSKLISVILSLPLTDVLLLTVERGVEVFYSEEPFQANEYI